MLRKYDLKARHCCFENQTGLGGGVSLPTHRHSLPSGVGSLVPLGMFVLLWKTQGAHPTNREGGRTVGQWGGIASLVFKNLVIKKKKTTHTKKPMNVTKVTFSDRFPPPTPFSPFLFPGGVVWLLWDDLFPLIILASFSRAVPIASHWCYFGW